MLALVLHHLILIAYAQGDTAQLAALLRESPALLRNPTIRTRMIASLLECLAGLATQQGQPEHGARLFGAARTLHPATEPFVWPATRDCLERDLARARTELGEAGFAGAWAAGQALTLEQALAYALQGLDSAGETAAS